MNHPSIRQAMFAAFFFLSLISFGQNTAALSNSHERAWCVVPFIGSGTFADPKRPMFAPTPAEMAKGSRTGIIAYSFQTSDDGRFALVQFVARNRMAFAPLLASLAPNVRVFLPGRDSREAMEAEFAKHKKNFDSKSAGVLVP